MRTISEEYREQNAQLHDNSQFYGAKGFRHEGMVKELMEKYGASSVLDYGCGKAGLHMRMGDVIRNYDPAFPEYAADPDKADLVVCGDVMEHVEPEYVDAVLAHMKGLMLKAGLFEISCKPARKNLPDGRNAHIFIRPPEWWDGKLSEYFKIEKRWEPEELVVSYVVTCLP